MASTTALQRCINTTWPLAQQSAAAVTAWLIAVRVAAHADPFFAPIAAVVGLNAALGRRGSNVVRLLAGVLIGVLVGEVALWLVKGGVWTLAAATFLAMLLARAVDDARIVRAQAAVSAILVTVLGHPERGWDRLVDAVIGAAVALAFTQLLFPPDPLRLLRRAEATVLSTLADGLRMAGDALANGDEQRAEAATAKLRNLRNDLAALDTTRDASDRVIRHALTWRRQARLVVAERERADYLDLLAGSCVMLSRTATAVGGPLRARMVVTVRQLAAVLDDLAQDPGDPATRQSAAEQAVTLVEHATQVPAQSALAAAYVSIRVVAADVMVFAGVDPDEAFADTFSTRREE
jgi:uncharacterized membrane protein YgaE (UPF0421/DUF939 family)